MSEQMTSEGGELLRRRITLADGRYMIFYTFGDEAQFALSADAETSRPEAKIAPGGEDSSV